MLRQLTPFVFLSVFTLSVSLAADKKAISPPGTQPNRPFSAGLMVGDTLYVSGQVGRTPDGKYPQKFEDEVQQTLDNINEVFKAAGMTLADAVSVQVYLTDMTLFERLNPVYMKNFPEPRPVRTTVGVSKLVGEARIEITVTASRPSRAGGKKK